MSQLAIYHIWNCQDQISVAPEERAKTHSVPCRRGQRPLHDSEDTDIQLGHIYLPINYLTRSDRHSRSVLISYAVEHPCPVLPPRTDPSTVVA
jgi:hypothetical protein